MKISRKSELYFFSRLFKKAGLIVYIPACIIFWANLIQNPSNPVPSDTKNILWASSAVVLTGSVAKKIIEQIEDCRKV